MQAANDDTSAAMRDADAPENEPFLRPRDSARSETERSFR